MQLSIILNDNSALGMEIENYSAENMAAIMNERQVNAFTLGSTVLNKNIVAYMVSAKPLAVPANVEIQLNNGQKISDYVEGYNAASYTDQLNNPAIVALVIGDSVINKNMIRMIKPLEQTTV